MSNINVATETSTPVTFIQVSGIQNFGGNNWREAILTFLSGIWSGDEAITHRQKLCFNNTMIRLGENEYYAYFTIEQDAPMTYATRPRVPRESLEAVSYPSTTEVEAGLIRFVRNNKIRQLSLNFPGVGCIVLTKGQKRSDLLISTEFYLDSMQAEMRRNGHQI